MQDVSFTYSEKSLPAGSGRSAVQDVDSWQIAPSNSYDTQLQSSAHAVSHCSRL